jgi:hypothetical protein
VQAEMFRLLPSASQPRPRIHAYLRATYRLYRIHSSIRGRLAWRSVRSYLGGGQRNGTSANEHLDAVDKYAGKQ